MTHDGVEHTKHDGVEELIAALERAPAIVIPLVRQADPAIVKRRPAPGEWSIHENACHLAEVHPLLSRRLDLLLAEENPASAAPARRLDEDGPARGAQRLLRVHDVPAPGPARLPSRLPDRGAAASQGLAGTLRAGPVRAPCDLTLCAYSTFAILRS